MQAAHSQRPYTDRLHGVVLMPGYTTSSLQLLRRAQPTRRLGENAHTLLTGLTGFLAVEQKRFSKLHGKLRSTAQPLASQGGFSQKGRPKEKTLKIAETLVPQRETLGNSPAVYADSLRTSK